jgi:SAM-dependent methyltransferase
VAAGGRALSIHEQAELGFARAAEAYERGRPEYPPAAIRWLREQLELGPGRTVLDVGAGTGKLTRALVGTEARLIALEPVAEMRAVLERQLPEVQVLPGRAEEIPLADGSVDAIVAGQAFHWFDGPRALVELHRVLRPGGRLGLIWNRRDGRQPLQQEIDRIIVPHRGATPAYTSDAWREAFRDISLFAAVAQESVPFDQAVDRETFVDRVMSISFISALPDEERARVQAALEDLADRALEPLRYNSQVFVYGRS